MCSFRQTICLLVETWLPMRIEKKKEERKEERKIRSSHCTSHCIAWMPPPRKGVQAFARTAVAEKTDCAPTQQYPPVVTSGNCRRLKDGKELRFHSSKSLKIRFSLLTNNNMAYYPPLYTSMLYCIKLILNFQTSLLFKKTTQVNKHTSIFLYFDCRNHWNNPLEPLFCMFPLKSHNSRKWSLVKHFS